MSCCLKKHETQTWQNPTCHDAPEKGTLAEMLTDFWVSVIQTMTSIGICSKLRHDHRRHIPSKTAAQCLMHLEKKL